MRASPSEIPPADETKEASPVDAVIGEPEAIEMSPVVAVTDRVPAVSVPPEVVMPLLFVKFKVLLTVKLASFKVRVPVLVLETNALPLPVVAALEITVKELVDVLMAAPEAPTLPVVAVSDTDEPVTRPAPEMELLAKRFA